MPSSPRPSRVGTRMFHVKHSYATVRSPFRCAMRFACARNLSATRRARRVEYGERGGRGYAARNQAGIRGRETHARGQRRGIRHRVRADVPPHDLQHVPSGDEPVARGGRCVRRTVLPRVRADDGRHRAGLRSAPQAHAPRAHRQRLRRSLPGQRPHVRAAGGAHRGRLAVRHRRLEPDRLRIGHRRACMDGAHHQPTRARPGVACAHRAAVVSVRRGGGGRHLRRIGHLRAAVRAGHHRGFGVAACAHGTDGCNGAARQPRAWRRWATS